MAVRAPVKLAYVATFGCQMNEHDTEKLVGMLNAMGYARTDNPKDADLILYNTCCVRANPERKVYGQIRNYAQLKQENPDLIIGICGCMVQQKGEVTRILEELPYVDLLFGTHNIHRLPELLQRAGTGEQVVEVWDEPGEAIEDIPVQRQDDLKAWVTVIYGCTNFCSYCIVPHVRGPERSRQPGGVYAEVKQLAEDGVKEITLLGQNVNAYGKDLQDSDITFARLLQNLDKIEGLKRIRFTTSHPKDMSTELIDVMAGAQNVCEHLHLPLQAGSDRILATMNRGYTRERYLDLVHRIRDRVPDISLTTDLIVGFPGETDADFAQTLEMVKEIRYDSAYTFIYSPRRGTPAARMEDQVSEEVKKERIYQLIQCQNKISMERNQQLLGTVQEVLVEGGSRKDETKLTGRTRQNKIVNFSMASPGVRSRDSYKGRILPVEITEAKTWSLEGHLHEC